jgi:FkbM family methyltransferase
MLISFSYIRNKYKINVRGILHVGAHHAEEACYYSSCGVNNVIWVEADPKTFIELQEKINNYPNHKSYCFAASNVDGQELDFYVASNGESSSILEMDKHTIYHPHITIVDKKKVFTKKVDTFLSEENISPNNYNFLSLDIQGAELLALKGMEKALNEIDFVYTEVNSGEVYKGCAKIEELDEYLSQFNFERVETVMTEYEWGDAFYIKKPYERRQRRRQRRQQRQRRRQRQRRQK